MPLEQTHQKAVSQVSLISPGISILGYKKGLTTPFQIGRALLSEISEGIAEIRVQSPWLCFRLSYSRNECIQTTGTLTHHDIPK